MSPSSHNPTDRAEAARLHAVPEPAITLGEPPTDAATPDPRAGASLAPVISLRSSHAEPGDPEDGGPQGRPPLRAA